MSLRPRYSLLTLLVLTALVAGGVKLWHGPHHVVKYYLNIEFEYSYTNDWRGNQLTQGIAVGRSFKDGVYSQFNVSYHVNDRVLWIYKCKYWNQISRPDNFPSSKLTLNYSPLSPSEREEFQAIIEREKQKLPQPSAEHIFLEYQGPPLEPND